MTLSELLQVYGERAGGAGELDRLVDGEGYGLSPSADEIRLLYHAGHIPAVKDLDAKILAAIKTWGTLEMGDWHSCETTHCRGGWAIALAGEAGRRLEEEVGVEAAAALIYARSTGKIPDFFCHSNDDVMADLEACASEQGAN